MSPLTVLLATLLLATGALSPASATVVSYGGLWWSEEIQVTGQGFGTQNNILTFQDTGTSTGCVKWTGTGDAFSAPCPGDLVAGPVTTGQSQTLSLTTLGSLGIDSAHKLGIVFNPNEPGSANDVTVQTLIVSFYSADGGVRHDFYWDGPGIFGPPLTFCCNNTGTGGAGQVFRFTWDMAEFVQQTWFLGTEFGGLDARIGLAAVISDVSAGAERFYAYQLEPMPIPEPASFLTMGSGLLLLAFVLRRYSRRKRV